MHMNTHAHTNTRTCTQIHTCTQYMDMHNTRTCTHTRTHTYMHMHTIYICMHTDAHACPLSLSSVKQNQVIWATHSPEIFVDRQEQICRYS